MYSTHRDTQRHREKTEGLRMTERERESDIDIREMEIQKGN